MSSQTSFPTFPTAMVPLVALSISQPAWSAEHSSVEPSKQPESRLFADARQARDTELPPVTPTRTRHIDIKHLILDLHFNWQHKQTEGTATLTLSPLQPTDKITLDAGMLTIQSVTLANGSPLSFTYDGGDRDDGLAITLDHTYPINEELTITITYRTNWINQSDPQSLAGSNGKGIRYFEPTSTEPIKRRQIWSMGEPTGNRYWFPSYDAPDDFYTSELIATVPAPLMLISNGDLVKTFDHPDGARTFHYKIDRPHANHLTSFVVGEYVDYIQEYEGIPLHSFGYPNEVQATRDSVVRLPDMAKFFSEATGVRYPYSRYSQVFVQDMPWGVTGASTSTLTENMVDAYRTHADFYYLWDGLEAEALAHQWFGGYLTAVDWNHTWLNRSFAHYFDGLYNEYKNGRSEFLLWQMGGDITTYLWDWNSGNRHPVITPAGDTNAQSYAADNYPYVRGALVLNMLRHHLGDDLWWKVIRQYLATYGGQSVSTPDFVKVVEEVSGEPMGWFFDQWLYKMGHPIFEVTQSYHKRKKLITLTVKQTQQRDPEAKYPQVDFFQGKMDIAVDGKIHRVWIEPRETNVLTFPSAQAPRLVNFDVESIWIKELTFEKSLDDLLYQLEHDTDVVSRRWAMTRLVAKAGQEDITLADKSRIVEGFRKVILSQSYWRVRFNALQQLRGIVAPPGQTEPSQLDPDTVTMLTTVIQQDRSWIRAQAIGILATTRDEKYVDLYLDAMKEDSHPVIYAAATALGQTKSPRAFDALMALSKIPSWKGENWLSTLVGLKALGDPRGVDVALAMFSDTTSPRWFLATPVWDFRIEAAQTLVALGKRELAYPILLDRFNRSVVEDDINDIFSNILLLTTLKDPRGQEMFDQLKVKYQGNETAQATLESYESQFKESINK